MCVYIYTHTYPLPLEPPLPAPNLGHHRTLSWAPCAAQQLPTSQLFHTWECVCQRCSLNLSCLLLPCQRRRWHPTPVLLPGKSHRRKSLVGCSPWGHKESDTTERLPFHFSLFTFMHWRRKWQPTPVFLPGESQGRGSLVGCRLWGHTESNMTEAT